MPVVIAGLVVAVVASAAAAFAFGFDGDSETEATPTPTATARATRTATIPAPSPTATAITPTTVPTPTVVESWTIDFQQTGGFAGLARSLSVSSDGQVRYEDERAGMIKTASLDAASLAELRALIDSSGFFSQVEAQTAPCADCFNFSITVSLNGNTHKVDAVEIAVDETLRPFIDKLVAALQDGLGQ